MIFKVFTEFFPRRMLDRYQVACLIVDGNESLNFSRD